MSARSLDLKGRWRSKTISFRMSPEEDEQLETFTRLSGLTKQDYIISRLLNREVIVQGNPRVYKAMRNELVKVFEELKRIDNGQNVDSDLLTVISQISTILVQMKGEI